jgi:hypothetical protein
MREKLRKVARRQGPTQIGHPKLDVRDVEERKSGLDPTDCTAFAYLPARELKATTLNPVTAPRGIVSASQEAASTKRWANFAFFATEIDKTVHVWPPDVEKQSCP